MVRPTLGLGIVCLGVIGACAQILGDDFEVGTGQRGQPGGGGDGGAGGDGESAQDLRPDCVAGHGCFGNPQTQQGECYRWCEPIGQQGGCSGGKTCTNASVPQFGTCQ